MGKKGRGSLFLLTLSLVFVNKSVFATTNNSYLLQEVKVVAPAKTQNLEKVSQEVEVIKGDEIYLLGPEVFSDFKLNKRGAFGVQQDLSIRGSTFEENIVTIEGIRISSPQTAHHLMNLPIEESNIKSVEILPGGASAIYGPGGFGGAVNFNLKPSSVGYKLVAGCGSYNYQYLFAKAGFFKKHPVTLSFSRKKSDGFIWDRDFDIKIFNLYTKDQKKTLFYGFQEKEFGARNFYTGTYPEWEKTQTHLFIAKNTFFGENWFLEPAFLYRLNHDTYVLDRNNPGLYENRHNTQVFRLNLPLRYETGISDYLLGTELSYETINSSRLGDHKRKETGFYLWFYPKLSKKFFPSAGLRYDIISESKDFFSYNIGLAYLLTPYLKLRSSFGFSYRIPSFTELYYDSPSIRGNTSLAPEKAYNTEAGFDYSTHAFILSSSVFYRYGKDIIDWINTGNVTQAQNIETLKTAGFTVNAKFNLKKIQPFLSYTYLNQVSQNLSKARYIGSYLTHNLILGAIFKLPFNTKVAGDLNYRKYYKSKNVYLMDLKIKKRLSKHISIYLWGKNLFNQDYEEFKGVRAIPRWIGVDLEARF